MFCTPNTLKYVLKIRSFSLSPKVQVIISTRFNSCKKKIKNSEDIIEKLGSNCTPNTWKYFKILWLSWGLKSTRTSLRNWLVVCVVFSINVLKQIKTWILLIISRRACCKLPLNSFQIWYTFFWNKYNSMVCKAPDVQLVSLWQVRIVCVWTRMWI